MGIMKFFEKRSPVYPKTTEELIKDRECTKPPPPKRIDVAGVQEARNLLDLIARDYDWWGQRPEVKGEYRPPLTHNPYTGEPLEPLERKPSSFQLYIEVPRDLYDTIMNVFQEESLVQHLRDKANP